MFYNLHFWKRGFVDLKADLTQTQGSVLGVRWYQNTFHWSMRSPSSTLPVNCYRQFPRTYGFTIAYYSALQRHNKLQCWASISGILLKQMLRCFFSCRCRHSKHASFYWMCVIQTEDCGLSSSVGFFNKRSDFLTTNKWISVKLGVQLLNPQLKFKPRVFVAVEAPVFFPSSSPLMRQI